MLLFNFQLTKYLLLLVLLMSGCNSQKKPETISHSLPQNKNQNVINDYSEIFTTVQNDSLASRLIEYEAETTNQIVIVTVDSITPYTDIQVYATDLANQWGVGQKDKDNGVAIVVSDKLRKISIATGTGTEKVLTDSICSQIIEKTIIPQFKKDEYYKGVSMGLDSLIYKWK